MCLEEWTDLQLLLQSALNSALSPSRGQIVSITAFKGIEPIPLIATFLRTKTAKLITITERDHKGTE